MSIYKKLLSQTALYGLSTLVGRLLNYLLTPLLTSLFLPEEFGIISYFYAIISFANMLFTYGMETAYFYFSKKYNERDVFQTTYTGIVISSILFASTIIIFRQPISLVLNLQGYEHYFVLMAFILLFDTLSTIPFGALRLSDHVAKFVSIKMAGIIINIGFTLLFAFAWEQNNSSNHAMLRFMYQLAPLPLNARHIFIANVLSSGVVCLLLMKEISAIRFSINTSLWRESLLYALPLLIAGFAGMINETLDRILISYLIKPPQQALYQQGIYGACYKLSILMTLFIQAFRFAAEPFFFNRKNEQNEKQVFANVMKYFVILCSLIFLFVMLNLEWIKYFINNRYWEGLHVVPILLLANLFLGVYLYQGMWYKLSGKTRYGAYISLAGAVITLVLNFILIPIYGYTGAAYTTLVCYASMMIISYFLGTKHYPIQYDLGAISFYFILSILLFAGCHYALKQNVSVTLYHVLTTIALIAFGGVVYFRENKVLAK
ncbi:MAG: polysaccharide biosynthesis C-terminal domain-containing protein [Bacteroidetes bacterium]|nr:polysaccharide biosynthesis C-terminal domain-containing protein [Bacteroidota bacterium]